MAGPIAFEQENPRPALGARVLPSRGRGRAVGATPIFLAAIADPKHENHREMKEWAGGPVSTPRSFSIEGVNREVKGVVMRRVVQGR